MPDLFDFFSELARKAWFSFLAGQGTTGLGFFTSNIEYFVATILVTHIVIWLREGRAAMRAHAAKNLLISVLLATGVLVVVFSPWYCRQFFSKVPDQIRSDAQQIPAPRAVFSPPKPPALAYFPPVTPEPTITLTPLEGFTFTPRGGENFTEAFVKDHHQYDLEVKNQTAYDLNSLDLRCNFPSLVDGYEMWPEKAAKFVPLAELTGQFTVHSSNGGLQFNGRVVHRVYELQIPRLKPNTAIKIRFLLNSFQAHVAPHFSDSIDYVNGSYSYSVASKVFRQQYYAPFRVTNDKVVTLGPGGKPPKVLDTTIDVLNFVP